MKVLSLCWALSLASVATASTTHNAVQIEKIVDRVERECSDMPSNCKVVLSGLGKDYNQGLHLQSIAALDEAMLKFQKSARKSQCVRVMNDCAKKIKQSGDS